MKTVNCMWGFFFQLTNQTWLKKKNIQVPIEQTPFEVKGHFHFMPPSAVKVVGSYLLGTCVRPDLHADVVLEIPNVSSFYT